MDRRQRGTESVDVVGVVRGEQAARRAACHGFAPFIAAIGSIVCAMAEDGAPSYPIKSVDRALTLQLMFQSRANITVSEASEELRVARSTAHRARVPAARASDRSPAPPISV